MSNSDDDAGCMVCIGIIIAYILGHCIYLDLGMILGISSKLGSNTGLIIATIVIEVIVLLLFFYLIDKNDYRPLDLHTNWKILTMAILFIVIFLGISIYLSNSNVKIYGAQHTDWITHIGMSIPWFIILASIFVTIWNKTYQIYQDKIYAIDLENLEITRDKYSRRPPERHPLYLPGFTEITSYFNIPEHAQDPYTGENVREMFNRGIRIVRCNDCGAYYDQEVWNTLGKRCVQPRCSNNPNA